MTITKPHECEPHKYAGTLLVKWQHVANCEALRVRVAELEEERVELIRHLMDTTVAMAEDTIMSADQRYVDAAELLGRLYKDTTTPAPAPAKEK